MADDVDAGDAPAVRVRVRTSSATPAQLSQEGGGEYHAPPPLPLSTPTNEPIYATDSDSDEGEGGSDGFERDEAAPTAPGRKIYDSADGGGVGGAGANKASIQLDASIAGESNDDDDYLRIAASGSAVEPPRSEDAYMVPTAGGGSMPLSRETSETAYDEDSYMLPIISPDYVSPPPSGAASVADNAALVGAIAENPRAEAELAASAAAASHPAQIAPTETALSAEDAARALFKSNTPGKSNFLVAASARGLLEKSGLSKKVVKGIWKKAKDGTAKATASIMSEEEFVKAYQFAVDAGGEFEGSPLATAAVPPATTVMPAVPVVPVVPVGAVVPVVPAEAVVYVDVQTSPADAARALFSSAVPADGSTITATVVSGLLAKSGLAQTVLKGIWDKAKVGSSLSGAMNESEFVKAYQFAVDAGGIFKVVATAADKDAARKLFKSSNPGSKLDVVKAGVASRLLSKGGLQQSVLEGIWNTAKADASAANSSVMNESEFVHAYCLAVEAGGNFEQTPAAATAATAATVAPTENASSAASPHSDSIPEDGVAPAPTIETAVAKKKGRMTLGNIFGSSSGGGGGAKTKKKTGIAKRNKRAGSQKVLMVSEIDEEESNYTETSFGI